eukprot:945415_1
MDKGCAYTFHFSVTVLVFAWPLYIYFISVLYSHRNHFVILNRWPTISLVIVVASVIIQTLTVIEAAFCITSLSYLSVGLGNALFGLVYYRTYLLYAQTMKTRYYLNSVKLLTHDDEQKGLHLYQYLDKLMLPVVMLMSAMVILGRLLNIPPIVYGSLTVTSLIGVVCIVNIARKKVSDSIGVTKECIFAVCINFIILSLGSAAARWVPSYIHIKLWLGFILTVLNGLAIVFIPYTLVRNEQTNSHGLSGLKISRRDVLSASVQQLPPLNDPCLLSMWLQKPLVAFLHKKMTNLQLFAGYLSECFALENILFLERAIVLHHVIRKYQQKDANTLSTVRQSTCKAFGLACYQLKFCFLNQIYKDMESIIENSNGTQDGIVHVMKAIHGQFCSRHADTEINVGYQIKDKLDALFEGKAEDEIVQQFRTYDDMLTAFDDAIGECWDMCETIYHFQFKSYLKRNVLPQEEDKNEFEPQQMEIINEHHVTSVSRAPIIECTIPSPVSP